MSRRKGKIRGSIRAERPGAGKSTGSQPRRDPHHHGPLGPYRIVECTLCGARVAANWFVRHVRSNCKKGIKA